MNAPAGVSPAAAQRRADEAFALVGDDAARATTIAQDVLRRSQFAPARSTAARALGLAAIELEDAPAAVSHMRIALQEAQRTNDSVLLADAEMGVAFAELHAGRRSAALRLAARAATRAPDRPRLVLQRAVILERLGDTAAAIAMYGAAQDSARRHSDDETLLRVHCNRGVLRIYRAELSAAHDDLVRAQTLARQLGRERVSAALIANRGFLAARRGALVEALALLDEATPAMESCGGLRLGIHALDRCEVLLLAGLPADAVVAGSTAITALQRAGMQVEVAEARVVTAQAALVAGDHPLARSHAAAAVQAFGRAPSPWAALAREVVVRADWATGRRDRRLLRDAAQLADDLAAAGWAGSAVSARTLAARIALDLGDARRATELLAQSHESRTAPIGLRLAVRHAQALARLHAGDVRGAKVTLRSAWRLFETHRSTLAATELRAGAATHAAALGETALSLAVRTGRPWEVLQWAELARAGALTPRGTDPPRDPVLSALLDELRVVAAQADDAAKHGADVRSLVRRQSVLESQVRTRAQLVPQPGGATQARSGVDRAALHASLGERALVEFVIADDELHVVVAAGGRLRVRALGPVDAVRREVDALRVALRRLAFGSAVAQLRDGARVAAELARGRLAALLLAPINALIGGRSMVIVPVGVLHAVPWAALTPAGVSCVVAPSAALWQRAAARTASTSSEAHRSTDPRAPAAGALLVAGPRLQEADAEVAALGRLMPGAHVLHGGAATVNGVRDAMGSASLVHLACHGHFRADNPLFSSLELHDGALSVFELERLGAAPREFVLSACDAGRCAVHPGDELLGLSAALLRLGTTGIVASVLPVPDAATRRLMVALHEARLEGLRLRDALAAASATLDLSQDDDRVAAWAFQVFGDG